MIGVKDLSDVAAELEYAADIGDVTTFEAGHERMLVRYKEVAEEIRDVCPPAVELFEQDDDSEILEFLPE